MAKLCFLAVVSGWLAILCSGRPRPNRKPFAVAARQRRDMRRSSKLSPAFLLKVELLSHPRLLCVIRGAMEPLMETLEFSESECRSITRAVDEALSNIMRHSYCNRLDQLIEVSCRRLKPRADTATGPGVEILLFDSGPAVEPSKLRGRPLDEIRPGGLGLHFMRSSMDTVEYKRMGRLNRLRLVKYAQSSKRRESVKEKSS